MKKTGPGEEPWGYSDWRSTLLERRWLTGCLVVIIVLVVITVAVLAAGL